MFVGVVKLTLRWEGDSERNKCDRLFLLHSFSIGTTVIRNNCCCRKFAIIVIILQSYSRLFSGSQSAPQHIPCLFIYTKSNQFTSFLISKRILCLFPP